MDTRGEWPGLGVPAGPDFVRPAAQRPPRQPPGQSRNQDRSPPAPALAPPAVRPPTPLAVRPPLSERPPLEPPPRRGKGRRKGRRKGRSVAMLLAATLLGGLAGTGAAWWLGPDAPQDRGVTQSPPSGRTGVAAGSEASAAAAVLPSVVQVRSDRGTGSGFVFDREGHVMTNAHVVEGDQRLVLQLTGGRQIPAVVVGRDARNDIAVLRADPDDLRPATMGTSRLVRIGEPVIAIGSPLGLTGTVTAGIVSTTQREARLGDRRTQVMIQTDASINPGNSGGPLVNLDGQVIGVNTAIATVRGPDGNGGNIGIGFAVPIDRALQVATRLLRE